MKRKSWLTKKRKNLAVKGYRDPRISINIVSIRNILVITLFSRIMLGFLIPKAPTHPKSCQVLDWNRNSNLKSF